uniref:Uncharacterized protein n=1 Tax=Rhizophora mucronata TaxID=61149 RepID=A0A2P2P7A9_RHIMU
MLYFNDKWVLLPHIREAKWNESSVSRVTTRKGTSVVTVKNYEKEKAREALKRAVEQSSLF